MNREFIHPLLAPNVPKETQVHLARAAEEASELVKEAMKALRFGLMNRYPADGPTNAEKIVAEFRDIEHALIDAGLFPIVAAERCMMCLRRKEQGDPPPGCRKTRFIGGTNAMICEGCVEEATRILQNDDADRRAGRS